jgi:arginyl-tRNA synthetase
MTAAAPLLEIASRLKDRLQAAAGTALGVELPDLQLTVPPQAKMGDFAVSSCLPLARVLKKNPRQIAQELVNELGEVEGVDRIEIAGAGYLNVFLDRPSFAAALLAQLEAAPAPAATVLEAPPAPEGAPKIVVEHTNINPNKAAHVGHLRNAVLGDSLVRLLQHSGARVEVQNYIDDTGVQVADVVVGFSTVAGRSPEEALAHVEGLLGDEAVRFDHVCWDVYARTGQWYAEDEESRLEHRRHALHAMESGEGPLADLGATVAEAIVRCHLATMGRLGIRYHVLPWESDILGANFWAEAFERMKAAKAVRLESEGKNAGCWVMPLSETPEFAGMEEADKIIVRSNGTVTYVGKDIAFQMWKFGLIGSDFRYAPFAEVDGKTLWTTDTDEGSAEGHPTFAHASTVYNVIDVRQAYLQKVVKNALLLCGHAPESERSIHYSYDMVALTPATAEALGFELSEEDRKASYVEMSGRKGLGVKADDFVDRLILEATTKIGETNDEKGLGLSDEQIAETAGQVAVGALRYYMLKVTRNRVIAFDIDEALQAQGETGPYLQYSAVRTASIFRKLEEQGEISLSGLADALDEQAAELLAQDSTWDLVMAAARIPEVLARCQDTLEVAHVAKHAFTLCQSWNGFYNDNNILRAETPELKRRRAAIARLFLLAHREMLGLLGIPEPERM